MDRGIPEINRHISERQTKVNKRIHYQKIRQVQPLIDNAKPTAMLHPIIKAKKE